MDLDKAVYVSAADLEDCEGERAARALAQELVDESRRAQAASMESFLKGEIGGSRSKED
ncbi:MAG: hypothetical protein GF393_09425 [Armatimonadia bacterium]|nr:hypothetical protein [Armatimonadia bacterium]